MYDMNILTFIYVDRNKPQLKSNTVPSPECLLGLILTLKRILLFNAKLPCKGLWSSRGICPQPGVRYWTHSLVSHLFCYGTGKWSLALNQLKSKHLCTLICQLYFPFWAFFVVVPFPYFYFILLISMTFKQNVHLIFVICHICCKHFSFCCLPLMSLLNMYIIYMAR